MKNYLKLIIPLGLIFSFQASYSQQAQKGFSKRIDRKETQAPKGLPDIPSQKVKYATKAEGKITGTAARSTNIQVLPSTNVQAECHVAVDRTDRNNILIGSNTYYTATPCGSGCVLLVVYDGSYYSHDGGNTWGGTDAMTSAHGDPSAAFDQNGNAYITLMNGTTGDEYTIYKSTDKGVSYSSITNSVCTPPGDFDKPMSVIDNTPSSSYLNNYYNVFTDLASGNIYTNLSTTGGASFSQPWSGPISSSAVSSQGANVQTGPNGEVYACWCDYPSSGPPANQISFNKSTNGGNTWLSTPTVAFTYTGIDVGGPNTDFNGVEVNDFPSMGVDNSCNSLHRGRIYIAYPEYIGGPSHQSVIKVQYMDPGGSWIPVGAISTGAVRCYFPWLTVDPATGQISVVYYAITDGTTYNTDVYVAYSSDYGGTWSNIKVNDHSFITKPISTAYPYYRTGYMGDYIGIAAYGGKAYAVWSADINNTNNWQLWESAVSYPTPLEFSNTTSPGDMNINGPVNITDDPTSATYYASNDMIAVNNTSTFEIQNGAVVTMQAGHMIDLKPGFHAYSGSSLDAKIGSVPTCSNALYKTQFIADDSHSSYFEDTKKEDANSDYAIFPNPSAGLFRVKINETNPNVMSFGITNKPVSYSYDIMDITGKTVSTVTEHELVAQSFDVDLSSFKPGVYFFHLTSSLGTKGTKKIIILGQ